MIIIDMARDLVCRKCAAKGLAALGGDALSMGWRERRVWLSVTTPADLPAGVFPEDVAQFMCDKCGEPVNHSIVLAITRIPPKREIGDWESVYGTVLPEEALATSDRLERE